MGLFMAKVLTVRQPFAWAILQGIKRVENRTWQTHFRGPLFIHAGKAKAFAALLALPKGWTMPREEDLAYGAILGSVELTDCLPVEKMRRRDRLTTGPYCWLLSSPILLPVPYPCAGQVRIWDAPALEVLR